MNIVRNLVRDRTGWRIHPVPASDSLHQEIPVTVSSLLLPSNAIDAALWVGYDARTPANRYVGWGWPADRLFSLKEDVLPLAGESPEIGALLLPGLAIAVAVNCLLPMQRAAILGKGLLAALVEEVLTCRNVQIEPVQPGAALSLIVDTSGDPTVWSSSLDALCGEGTLLLLVPPWSTPADFNFYPYLHRHSLRVIARRWHRLPPVSEWVDRDSLAQVIASVLQRRRWLCPMNLNLGISETNGEAWQWFDWKPHKQKR
jgi:hypothetical protein